MDKIIIRDLLLRGIIGINPHERGAKQEILLTMVIFADLRPADAPPHSSGAVN